MPLLGFTVFKQKILDGSKCQTIRKLRKHPIKEGDKLYLYWHLRQRDCEKLGEAVCTETFQIQFDDDLIAVSYDGKTLGALTNKQKDNLAKKDGFQNEEEMIEWFWNKYPNLEDKLFQVIRWKQGEQKQQ